MSQKIVNNISKYYSDKIKENGPNAKGVDWNSTDSQELRFQILSEIIEDKQNFSVLDFGCGYGSLYDYYVRSGYKDFMYIGYDISKDMLLEAQNMNKNIPNVTWTVDLETDLHCDYVIASGIFNVKLEVFDEKWMEYILETLNKINKISKKGFSFNVLTKYSDVEFMKDYLYYADPLFLFDYCKKNFSKYVALRHDYPLYEFSIIVKK